MPLRKKVTKNSSGSYLISLPKQWVDNLTKTLGEEIKEVLIEVDNDLIVRPVLKGGSS